MPHSSPCPRLAALGVLVALAGCTAGGTGSVQTVGIRGIASPGADARQSAIVVFDADATVYWRGMSEADGSFRAEVPATLDVALIAAINPADPSEQAYGSVDVGSMASSPMGIRVSSSEEIASRQDALVGEGCVISGLSSAEFIARSVMGTLSTLRPLDVGEQALADAISTEISGRYCDSDAYPNVLPPAALGNAGVDEVAAIRAATQTGPDILSRLRAGQLEITENVRSSNQLEGLVTSGLAGAPIFVTQTRAVVNMLTGFAGGSFYPDGPNLGPPGVPGDRIEAATRAIMGAGWGNCREKGIAGAFVAGLVDEIQTVYVLGIDRDYSVFEHSVALACTSPNVDVFDWQRTSRETPETIPQHILDAGCYIIDPWDGTTYALTERPSSWNFLADYVEVNADARAMRSMFSGDACPSPACEPFDPAEVEPVRPSAPRTVVPVPGTELDLTICGWSNGDSAGCNDVGSCLGECDHLTCLRERHSVRISGNPSYPVVLFETEEDVGYTSFSMGPVNADDDTPRFGITTSDGSALPRILRYGSQFVPNIRPINPGFQISGLPPLRTGVKYRADWFDRADGTPARGYGVRFFIGPGNCFEL